jgi:hypothetical protein
LSTRFRGMIRFAYHQTEQPAKRGPEAFRSPGLPGVPDSMRARCAVRRHWHGLPAYPPSEIRFSSRGPGKMRGGASASLPQPHLERLIDPRPGGDKARARRVLSLGTPTHAIASPTPAGKRERRGGDGCGPPGPGREEAADMMGAEMSP